MRAFWSTPRERATDDRYMAGRAGPAAHDCMAYCYGGSSHVEYGTEHDQALIVAAVNALPGLLDALDAAEETDRQHLLREDLLRGQVADLEAERDALLDTIERVRALAAAWRYDGRYGWGPWQAGEGPDPEGETLDFAALELVRALDGADR